MRKGVPRVLVVITDGRSQDETVTFANQMHLEGMVITPRSFLPSILLHCHLELGLVYRYN